MDRVLVIDDEEDIHYSFQRNFQSSGWGLTFASSGEQGLDKIQKEAPSVVVMDVRMAGMDGLETLKHIRKSHVHLPVIIMTAHGTTQTAIEAMRNGAFDYLTKPFDVERMEQIIRGAIKASHDMRDRVSYQPLLQKEEYDQGIIGKTEPMQEVYKIIGQVADSDIPVMITGETGTGKELVARAIVQHGRRANKPFLAINCAAIPENLLESELFGHEKGAFTGATERRIGKFEQCDGGTIFLDEIGEMPLPIQAKLLRAIQEGEISRVGSNQVFKVDIRFIAATNRDPESRVKERSFREDLYYRLNVVRIKMPPLRQRREDIPLLVEYFLQMMRQRHQCKARSISPDGFRALTEHDWPGNVRELQNVIERAAVVCGSETITPQHITLEPGEKGMAVQPKAAFAGIESVPDTDSKLDLEKALKILFAEAQSNPGLKLLPWVERQLIAHALALTHGNHVQAAKLIGVTRATLRKRVEKFGIKKELNIS
jgi:nitrogen regulation protein NR(I)